MQESLQATIKAIEQGKYLSPCLKKQLPRFQQYTEFVRKNQRFSWKSLAKVCHVSPSKLYTVCLRMGYTKPPKSIFPILKVALQLFSKQNYFQKHGVRISLWAKRNHLKESTVFTAMRKFGFKFPTPRQARVLRKKWLCSGCHKELPLDCFYMDKHYGRQTRCKSCNTKRLRKYMRIKNKTKRSHYRV